MSAVTMVIREVVVSQKDTSIAVCTIEKETESSSGETLGTSSGKVDPTGSLQIVGMSATLPNVTAVAHWLQGVDKCLFFYQKHQVDLGCN